MSSDDNRTDPLLGISTSGWDRRGIREKTHEQLKRLNAGGSIQDILPTIEFIAFDSLTYTIDEEMEQRLVQ